MIHLVPHTLVLDFLMTQRKVRISWLIMVGDGFRSMSISVSISDVFRAGEFRVVAWSVQHFKRQPRKMVKHTQAT